jgi:predicted dehydrogenase
MWFIERQLSANEAATAKVAANDRPGVALVGCGGMGTVDARNAANYGDVVAVCDVDADQAAAAATKLTVEGKAPPQVYRDFRRMLERSDVQIVLNGTPDHWHTLVNLGAVRAGKDVYSEKPLTLTIDEGRRLVAETRKHGRVLQTGTQQRSSQRFRMACELVRNGRIGRLQDVKVWLPAGLREGPFATAATPAALDWDFWQGPAPRVDYVPERTHVKVRFWYDYSGGTTTDWGAHHIDIASWAIGETTPVRIESTRLSEPIPGGFTAVSDYEVRLFYRSGVRLTVATTRDDDIFGRVANPQGQRNGLRFEGTNGWIWVNRSELRASDPELLRTPLAADALRFEVSIDHMQNFMECVRSRRAPICDVEVGHRSATVCHLGTIALRTGRALTWDPETERFTGDHAAEGNAHVAREMRAPYDYSFVA